MPPVNEKTRVPERLAWDDDELIIRPADRNSEGKARRTPPGVAAVIADLQVLRARLSGALRDELNGIIDSLAGLSKKHGNHDQRSHGRRRTGTLGSVLDKLESLADKLSDDDRSVLERAMAQLRDLESSDVDDDDLIEDEPDDEGDSDDDESDELTMDSASGDVAFSPYGDGTVDVDWDEGSYGFRLSPQSSGEVADAVERLAALPLAEGPPPMTDEMTYQQWYNEVLLPWSETDAGRRHNGIIDEATTSDGKVKVARYGDGSTRIGDPDAASDPDKSDALQLDTPDEANQFVDLLRHAMAIAAPEPPAGKSAKTRSHSMSTKSFRPTFKNVGDKGEVTFVVATLNEVDKDGDVTLPGFFGKQHVAMVPVHDWNHVPIGKGLLYEQGNEVLCDVKLNLRIPAAKDWYEAIKFDYENPPALVEYSYGFDVLEGGQKSGYHNGRNVRFLQPKDNGLPGVKVHEVSPVLVGAGTNTRTVSVKGRSMRINRASGATTSTVARAVKGAIPSHETKTASRPWDNAKTVKALPEDSLPSELRTVFAWVDPDGDNESLTSYKMAHHHGISGPANLRACLIGIAELNQGTSDIPDADRKGVYDHLAAHIRDADREPPELRIKGSGPAKQYDQLLEGLATLSGLIDGVYSGAARQEKGRGLSKVKSELLGWIGDDLTRLKALLSQPAEPEMVQPSDDELASLAAASLARINGF